MPDALQLVEQTRSNLKPLETKISRHPYLRALEEGRVQRDSLKVFAGQQHHIISSDLRSIALILSRQGLLPSRRVEVLKLKAATTARGAGPVRVKHLIVALKSFLRFCEAQRIAVALAPHEIRAPKIPRREVVFLTPDEVEQFVSAIPIELDSGKLDLRWLAFRAFVELLLGSGLRLSEALSLTRTTIDFRAGEAKIVGKGNKERVVFLTPRALAWVKEYLTRRQDQSSALFALPCGRPFRVKGVQHWFVKICLRAGLAKPVTAHILRHTVATTLLFRGCAIGHIKEALGHEHLETTCRYYLGVDKRETKAAHRRYLDYEHQPTTQS